MRETEPASCPACRLPLLVVMLRAWCVSPGCPAFYFVQRMGAWREIRALRGPV